MRMLLAIVAAACAMAEPAAAQEPPSPPAIRLNTVGFLPYSPKRATVAADAETFTVVRVSDGAVVLRGDLSPPTLNVDTDEQLRSAEFLALTDPGEYRVEIPGGHASPPFLITANLYRKPFRLATRAMYLWRCGTAVHGEHGGVAFAHQACHLEDALLDYAGQPGQRLDAVGGWHDAGDYNKYVVNAAVTVGCMARAWEDFGGAIARISLALPASESQLPDFLAELKWEIDWLLKMQAPDGSVYHKLSTERFGKLILPEEETTPRFVSTASSAATADFIAMTALAARLFAAHDTPYAERCLAAARRSHDFLKSRPDDFPADLRDFHTGQYQTHDWDDRLWALAELWEATGDADLLAELEASLRKSSPSFRGPPTPHTHVDVDWDWTNVRNLALTTYLFSTRPGRDEALVAEIRKNCLAAADGIVESSRGHGYGRPLGRRYYWGANGSVARQAIVLHAADRLAHDPKYRETIIAACDHLLGRNCYGRSFVTGLGASPPLYPHDRRSAGDKVDAPWPGYLVGGPNPGARDWHDLERDYRTNEIAINWNAALIYATAALLEKN